MFFLIFQNLIPRTISAPISSRMVRLFSHATCWKGVSRLSAPCTFGFLTEGGMMSISFSSLVTSTVFSGRANIWTSPSRPSFRSSQKETEARAMMERMNLRILIFLFFGFEFLRLCLSLLHL